MLTNPRNNLIKTLKSFWPIEIFELKKFIPIAMLAFCILLNYGILRSLKDALVIVSISAEATFFIKLWGVLPAALVIMVCYSKLVNVFKEEKVFYIIVGFFFSYFTLFHFYLAPNAEAIHPDKDKIQVLAASYPFLKYFIYIYGKWIYSSFYIMAEMWGSTVLTLLFWQFANKVSTTEEAKRFYPLLVFFANIALIVTGILVKDFSNVKAAAGSSNKSLADLVLIVLVLCSVICALYRWIHVYVLSDPKLYLRVKTDASTKEKKPRLSMKESFKLIANSRYLGLVAILVVSYGCAINLLEGSWKAKVKQLCPTEDQFAYFMGHFAFIKGITSLFFLVLGSYMLRKFSWLTTALVAPVVFLVSGTLFFLLCIFQDNISYYSYALIGMETLTLVVTVGTIQNILSRCVTFAFFDSTKEMAYIPINKELKTKGKAAVDLVGTRLGKSGSALIQSLGLIIFHNSSLISSVPYIMVVFIAICSLWIWAVLNLNKKYVELIDTKNS